MNYLQLAQKLAQNLSIPGGGPASVLNQVGTYKQLVDWVTDAWVDIQTGNDGQWKFLRREFTLNTVAGTDAYDYGAAVDVGTGLPIDRFNQWAVNDIDLPPRLYLAAAGRGSEQYLSWTEWDSFRALYLIGLHNDRRPGHITLDPQDRLRLGPTPDAEYVVTSDYWRGPQVLVADADEPEVLPQFHDLIVYRAMVKYAYESVAPEQLSRAETEGGRLASDFERRYSWMRARFIHADPLA